MQLLGAHVLVTGASRGIGARVAQGAAARGATVTLVARSADALRATAHELAGHALPCDLGDPVQRADLVDRAEAAAGRPVDVLVSCAGVDQVSGMLELTGEQLRQVFEVNLAAPAELLRQLAPRMVARGSGHLVTVSSGFSTVLGPGFVPYAASKSGLSHFHAGLRLELRGTGVGMTLVEPGPVRTAMYADIEAHRLASAVMRRFLRLRLTRMVDPEDVAVRILEAIEHDRAHVVPVRRMVPVLAFDWLPRRVSELVLTGVPRR